MAPVEDTDIRGALGALGAIQDESTRLPNRRSFRMIGQQLLDVSARHQHALALFLLRVQNLEQVRAASSPREAQWTLVALAEALRSTFRESDLVARLREDEFAVIATATTADEVPQVEGRLATQLSAAPALRTRPHALDLRVGAAPYGRGDTLNALLERATDALHPLRRDEAA